MSPTFGEQIGRLARQRPDDVAVVFSQVSGARTTTSWRQLDQAANRIARMLREHGVGPGRFVMIELPNSPDHLAAAIGVWKAGGCVVPANPELPEHERQAVIAVARPSVVLSASERPHGHGTPLSIDAACGYPSEAPASVDIPDPARAMLSGGSTGTPKVIVLDTPGRVGSLEETEHWSLGLRSHQVQLVPGALHHNTPFGWAHAGLRMGQQLVLLERFDAELIPELIEFYRVGFTALVPTMMRRIAAAESFQSADLSSLEAVFHTAGACPAWVREVWIKRVGASRLVEGYGATEPVGSTQIRGDEWLSRRGSVGLPWRCDLSIRDDEGHELPTGDVGTIYMRPHGESPAFHYLGQEAPQPTSDGFYTVGDLGYLDLDGFLYFADRRVDMITSGGANVYPAEVEGVLLEHPEVFDVAVIGIPDSTWGRRVHAVVVLKSGDQQVSVKDLRQFCRERLASYKVPKSVGFAETLPRDEAGKLRRSRVANDWLSKHPTTGDIDKERAT